MFPLSVLGQLLRWTLKEPEDKASSSHCWTFCFLRSSTSEPHNHFNTLLRRLTQSEQTYSCSSELATTARDLHFEGLDYSPRRREILPKVLQRENVFTMNWLKTKVEYKKFRSCWKETRGQVPNNYLHKTGWIRSLFSSPHLPCIFIFKWTNLWTKLNYFLAFKTYIKKKHPL